MVNASPIYAPLKLPLRWSKDILSKFRTDRKALWGKFRGDLDYYALWDTKEKRSQVVDEILARVPAEEQFAVLVQAFWDQLNRPRLYVPFDVWEWLESCTSDYTEPITIWRNPLCLCFERRPGTSRFEQSDLFACLLFHPTNEKAWYDLSSVSASTDPCLAHIRIKSHDVEKLIRAPQAARDIFEDHDRPDWWKPSSLEVEMNARYIRMAYLLGSYQRAFPNALKLGPPPLSGLTYMEQKNTAHFTIPHSKGKSQRSPISHLRRAHFRELRDERYKRDKDGKCRVVLVRASLIHGRGDVHVSNN